MTNRRILVAILIAVLLIGPALFFWLRWQFDRPPVSSACLNGLRVGMTTAQVENLCGTADSTSPESWAHSRVFGWPILYIDFEDGRVTDFGIDY